MNDAHAIALQLVLDDFDFVLDGDAETLEQVLRGDVRLHAVAATVDAFFAPAAQIQHGFAQRLAGDRAGMCGDAADDLAALDDGRPLAELGCLDGGALATGTAADNQQIEAFHACLSGLCVLR